MNFSDSPPPLTMLVYPPLFLHLSASHLGGYPEILRSAQGQQITELAAERGLGV